MSSKRFPSDDEWSIDVDKLNKQLPDITGLCLGSLKKEICCEVKQFAMRLSCSQENTYWAGGSLKGCGVVGGEKCVV